MVSLSNENRRSGGYFFHDDPSVQGRDDVVLLDSPTLSSDVDSPFRQISTVWAISLQLVILIADMVAMLALPWLCTCENNKCGTSPATIMMYTQGAMWVVCLLFDRYYRHKHNQNRMYGYLEFYRQTRQWRRIPLLVTSGADALLLVVVTVLADKCGIQCYPKGSHSCGKLHFENYLQIIIVGHLLVVIVCLIYYLTKTVKFNGKHAGPDVAQDEVLTSFVQSSISSEIGFKDEHYTEQVLEKQSDMIRYLKQHNSQLAKRVLSLTAENNSLRSPTS